MRLKTKNKYESKSYVILVKETEFSESSGDFESLENNEVYLYFI